MLRLSLDGSGQPLQYKYILTPANKLQPLSDTNMSIISDVTVDHSPLVTTSINSINELGKQLLKAAGDGDAHEVKILLSQGSPFTSDWLGTSPLHLAAQNNNVDVCEVLLKGGIGKDARNKVDRTPLHLAAYEGHYEATETLIKHGSDINCKDMLNMTPLHWAVQNGHSTIVDLLLRSGAQANERNKFDLTPQDIALQINKIDILDLLQAYEEDPQAATENLVMQLQNDDLNNEAIQVQDSNDGSGEGTKTMDPVIINLNNEMEGIEDEQIVNNDPIIINLCEDDAKNTNEGPNESNSMPTLLNSQPTTSFKIINGVIHPVEDTDASFSAVDLLQEHGITMLPNDTEENNILNTVMESGHSVVLTEIGKEVLNTVKRQEEKVPLKTIKTKKIITITPEEFLSITNGQYIKNASVPGLPGKVKIVPIRPNARRVVMKKNRPTPFGNMIKVQTTAKNTNNNKTELEYLMDQLVEARKTIEEYKIKLKKKEVEAERYKMQLKLLMDAS